LADRIGALGAPFDTAELQRARQQLQLRTRIDAIAEPAPQASAVQLTPLLANITLTPAEIIASVGNTQVQHLKLAEQLRASLPAAVITASAQSDKAIALFLAMAMSNDSAQRGAQLEYLRRCMGEAVTQRITAMLVTVDQLNVLQRQPALLCMLPQLRQLPRVNRVSVASCLNGLLPPVNQLNAAQYALRKLAQVQLHDVDAGSTRRVPHLNLVQAIDSLQPLLATLAHQGHASAQQARQAYERAMQHLPLRRYAEYTTYENWPSLLDTALLRLDRLPPLGKQMLIEAMLLAVSHDQQITVEEAELLRAFCACLHCPVPLLLTANVSI
jgi:hypothetical protein